MSGQPLTYRDLNLELSDLRHDGSFAVRLLGTAPNNSMMGVNQAERAIYHADEVTSLLSRLLGRTATKAELLELGAKLCALLLPGKLAAIFEQSLNTVEARGEGLRLRLSIAPLALAALPWEFAHFARTTGEPVPGDFLALMPSVSLARREETGRQAAPLAPKTRFRIVAALAGGGGDTPALAVDADERAIRQALAAVGAKLPVETVVLREATRAALVQALQEADIFHFAGHGLFALDGMLFLAGDDGQPAAFHAEQLAVAIAGSGARLVMLGACFTAQRDEGGHWNSLAAALARDNTPAVVAMQLGLSDKAAPLFAASLYERVLRGESIDQAVAAGRRAIFESNPDWAYQRDWGIPVLTLQTADGVLFPAVAGRRDLPPADDSGATPMPNKRDIRLALLNHFDPTALEELCADIQQDIADAGNAELRVNLAMIGGGNLTAYALNLINYLDQRGYLEILVAAIRRARPGVI